MSLVNPKRPNNFTQDRIVLPLSTVAAISATTVIPMSTFASDWLLSRFEIEVPGGYVADAAAYYDVSLQLKPAAVTAVAATDICTSTAHGLETGDSVQFTNSGGGLPGGLSAGVTYFAIKLTADTFKVATSAANAAAGTAINITTAGTGTHSVAKVLAMYSLKTGQNGTLTDLVFADATNQQNPAGLATQQLNFVLTKFSTAADVPAGTRLVAHLSTL